MSLSFKVTRNQAPLPDSEREAIIANPTFGTHFTDHQVVVVWEKDKGCQSAAMLARHIGEVEAANRLEAAIATALAKGQSGKSTTEIADAIFENL